MDIRKILWAWIAGFFGAFLVVAILVPLGVSSKYDVAICFCVAALCATVVFFWEDISLWLTR